MIKLINIQAKIMNPTIVHIKEFSTRVVYNGQTLSAIKPTLLTSCELSNIHKGCSFGHLIKILVIHMNDPVINTLVDPHFTVSGQYIGVFLNTNLPGNFLWINHKKQLEHVCGCIKFKAFKPIVEQSKSTSTKRSRFMKHKQEIADIPDIGVILDDPDIQKDGGKLFYVNDVKYEQIKQCCYIT